MVAKMNIELLLLNVDGQKDDTYKQDEFETIGTNLLQVIQNIKHSGTWVS